MILKDIINILEKKYPKYLAEEWDNVGLLVGNEKREIKKIQISLDVTENTIENAIRNNVDLIISHHPFIFNGIKQINTNSILGNKIIQLIKNDIAVYSMHTNLDSAKYGLNDFICKKLKVENSKIISENIVNLYKIKFEYNEKILKKLEKYNFFNKKNNVQTIEIFDTIENINKVVSLLNSFSITYELLKLENKLKLNTGLGRIYNLKKEIRLLDYIEIIKEKLDIKNVRVVYNENKFIKKIAIVNGSGMSFLKKAKKEKVDLFITGDIKYHEALDCFEEGFSLVDIGHYESEHFFNELILDDLKETKLEIIIFNDRKIFNYL
ncbi:dinuclear metal center YbgI/SA1388 family protein [Hypnocyclicus thermotrophus]|uniref:GTP cyclohydrolase 1 type 2 homolog n=1 Tax=Hypnocyclicus thermotrophus TaxID=1627895 RepID=A0AA46DXS5_9FUSO|nr:Nif3-like dinuclear metal center hexameric protein [Hypnocyclicus thermotrophus]TDT67930.1 dinuclear metal center YbgI/SA1388 family protein [Hypnocyclicus thermotrophus]